MGTEESSSVIRLQGVYTGDLEEMCGLLSD